jgi:hypothetical protein
MVRLRGSALPLGRITGLAGRFGPCGGQEARQPLFSILSSLWVVPARSPLGNAVKALIAHVTQNARKVRRVNSVHGGLL